MSTPVFRGDYHSVKLMAPQFVKPYVKTNKHDAADAEAICEAVTPPNMRFVPIKSPEQQAVLALHRSRQGFIKQRTAQANQIRGLASLWGLRQFQPLKGPSVGVWRELRRLPGRMQEAKGIVVAPLASPIMEECRHYADAADWKNFTQAMGGPCCRRDSRPLSLYHTAKDEPNQYGEPVTKLLGVWACDGTTLPTRIGDWVLRKCGTKGPPVAKGGQCVAVGERSEPIGLDRGCNISPLGALAITVREDLVGVEKDPKVEKALFHLGLDGDEITMMRRGSIVKSRDRYVCMSPPM